MKKITVAISILVIIVVIGAIFAFSPKQNEIQEAKIVKIGYLPITASLPLFIAQEEGYFSEQGLDVELVKFETSNQVIDALVRGDIEVEAGASSFVTVTASQTEPEAIKVFMVNSFTKNKSISSLIVSKGSFITSIQELKGKKIGSFPGSTMKAYTQLFLEENGAFDESTQIIELAPSLQLQALSSGSIDALLTLEPIPTIGEFSEVSDTLISAPIESDVLTPWVAGTFSFNSDFSKSNEAQEIEKAFSKAVDFMRENPQVSKKFFIEYTAITHEDLASEVPLPNTLKRNEIMTEDFQRMSDLLLDEEILTKSIDVNSIIVD